MAKGRNLFANVRLVYRRSSPLLKCVVLAAIVVSIAAVLILHATIHKNSTETDDLRDQAAQLEQENSQLEDKIDKLDTVEGMEDIAGEELDLVDPDTTIYESDD